MVVSTGVIFQRQLWSLGKIQCNHVRHFWKVILNYPVMTKVIVVFWVFCKVMTQVLKDLLVIWISFLKCSQNHLKVLRFKTLQKPQKFTMASVI